MNKEDAALSHIHDKRGVLRLVKSTPPWLIRFNAISLGGAFFITEPPVRSASPPPPLSLSLFLSIYLSILLSPSFGELLSHFWTSLNVRSSDLTMHRHRFSSIRGKKKGGGELLTCARRLIRRLPIYSFLVEHEI